MPESPIMVRVVLFTGGRGSRVMSRELLKNPRIQVTLAINGYDDGLSTGEIRRFLGDSLGPSDFRKNASGVAAELRTCPFALVELLDLRFPREYGAPEALAAFRQIRAPGAPVDAFQQQMEELLGQVGETPRRALADRLELFQAELARTSKSFEFSDCSIGNLVFVGSFLVSGRHFNRGVEDYCNLLGLPPGLIMDVTDGQNLYLVALDENNRILPTEAEIVGPKVGQQIRDIYLLERPIPDDELKRLEQETPVNIEGYLDRHSVAPRANEELLQRIAEADLIVYAPGTQHSSLFPSYLTPGLGESIADNLRAIKLFITNLHEDAEIAGNSAVDIVQRALYYLRGKGRLPCPAPALITHYLINDADPSATFAAYVPPGRLETIDDPRLVRIGNFEDRITGHHDVTKVLPPFVEALLRKGDPLQLAVVLLETRSLDKASQTMIEMVRAGLDALPVQVTVFYQASQAFDSGFIDSLPFEVRKLPDEADHERLFTDVIDASRYEYVVLFESSGMYKGEDIVSIAGHLSSRRLDAVWGSRRLSVNDIKQAYRLVYRRSILGGAISYMGSHVLSLAYLVFYGRYIADTLSGVRAIRASYLRSHPLDPARRDFNQQVLTGLLRERAEVIETPVHYFPISPEKIRRTTIGDGWRSLLTIVLGRFRRPAHAPPGDDHGSAPPLSGAAP
ncbi:MAG: 2-phospho-L-lactate transferase CofD family protein [Candidatus Eisenbacteria bacterium]|nr:2-phospho-L-lactate transferase CofD family protein [Candidatus Eisenbacteria bacterium]